MSWSKSQNLINGVNVESPISEIISPLRQSYQQKDFDEVERVMMMRENKLQTELRDLKRDFASLRGNHDSLKIDYKRVMHDKRNVEQELMNCKGHLKQARQHVDKLRVDATKIHTRYKCVGEELRTVELERAAERSKKDEELKKVMTENLEMKNRELQKMEENETLAKMVDKLKDDFTEKLAEKDSEINELKSERDTILEDLVAKVLFLQEDIKKYDVDSIHKKTDHFQEALLETLSSPVMESSIHKGSCDGPNSAIMGENGDLEVENLHNAVYKQPEIEKTPDTLPTITAEPSMNVPVIDLSSDDEDKDPVSTFRQLKRARSFSSTSESDDSLAREFKEKRVCDVRDTAQSKGVRTWVDDLFEKEGRKGED